MDTTASFAPPLERMKRLNDKPMHTPTGRDLDHAIALGMGWTVKGSNPPGTIYIDRDGHKAYAMGWHASLDALFAPGGPVEYARNKGLRFTFAWVPDFDGYEVAVFRNRDLLIEGGWDDPAEALATALHEALMKEQGQEMNDAE